MIDIFYPPDHGILQGLTDDDHTQYVLLAGRSGGQTIYGSTVTAENLILRANSVATNGNVRCEGNFRPFNSLTFSLGSTGARWNYIYAALGLQIAANNFAFQIADTTGSGLYFDNAIGSKKISFQISSSAVHDLWMAGGDDGAVYHLPRTSDPSNASAQGTLYVWNNGSSDSWLKMRSNSVWTEVVQREAISVTPSATVTLTHHQFTDVYSKWTAGENETVNASGTQKDGQMMYLLITNDATSARTITFGTGFKPSGTIVGTVNKSATITFRSDGTNWWETGRTLLL
jgi:hypothetical protein